VSLKDLQDKIGFIGAASGDFGAMTVEVVSVLAAVVSAAKAVQPFRMAAEKK